MKNNQPFDFKQSQNRSTLLQNTFKTTLTMGRKKPKNYALKLTKGTSTIRLGWVLSAFFLVIGFSQNIQAQSVDFISTVSSPTITVGDTFSVTIALNTSDGTTASTAAVAIDFNPAIIEVISLNGLAETELAAFVSGPFFNNTDGTLSYQRVGLQPYQEANFNFLTINFQALASGTTDLVYTDINITSAGFPTTVTGPSGSPVLNTPSDIQLTIGDDNELPLVSITSPTSGDVFTAGDLVSVAATASDNDGTISGVEFFDGALSIGTDNTPPYEATISSITEGAHSLTAVAIDNDNGQTISEVVNITANVIANMSPTIASIANQSVTEGQSLDLSSIIDVSDLDGNLTSVEVTSISNENNLPQGPAFPFPANASGFLFETNTTSTGSDYESDLTITPSFGDGGGFDGSGSGTYDITVTATDAEGDSSTVTFTLTVLDAPQPISDSTTTVIEGESFDNQSGIGVEVNTPQPPGVTNVSNSNEGDSVSYEIDVATAGLYDMIFTVGRNQPGSKDMTIKSNGVTLNTITVPNTTGWQVYIPVPTQVSLPAGVQTLEFVWEGGSSGSNFFFNVDKFEFQPAGPPAPFQLCIASGSTSLNAFGREFEQDFPASNTDPTGSHPTRTNGKKFVNYDDAIAGTSGPDELLLFQKEIYGGAGGSNPSFSYDVPVDDGFYMVDLYFAEIYHPNSGGRIFDVLLEGNVILDEYDLVDPIKDGLASNKTAITRTYYVEVTDGTLSVQVGPASTDNGKLSGLCITEVASANLHPITNIGDLTFDALVTVAETLNISDNENDQFSIIFNGLPASLTYNPVNNQLEGIPTVGDVGTFTVNAIVSDGTNSPVTEEFLLTINPAAGNDPPVIAEIDDINIAEGGTASTSITITDDNSEFNTRFVLYDKSNSSGSANEPITPSTVIPDTDYTFTDNTGGNYSFSWSTNLGDGRSYLGQVTTDDGINPAVVKYFSINVAQAIPATILAKTFASPLPWYGADPVSPFTVAIEANGNQNIGYIGNNEFVEYLIDVPTPGAYELIISAANNSGTTTTISVSESNGSNGFDFLSSVDVPDLPPPGNAWQNYADYTATLIFTNSGTQRLRLDFGGGVNILDFDINSISVNTPPTVNITSPLDGAGVEEGEVTLIGTATDIEDSALTADAISWSSDLQGALGIGASFTTSLNVGTHLITASVTDSGLETSTASITLVVQPTAGDCDILYRVNAGGNLVTDWTADAVAVPSIYLTAGGENTFNNSGNNGYEIVPTPLLPFGTPLELFETERWDPPGGDEMLWQFPVAEGTEVEVTLYFAEIYGPVTSAGVRSYDVALEGVVPNEFNDIDPFAIGGGGGAFGLTATVTVEGETLDIEFLHDIIENPNIKAIQVCKISDPISNDSPVFVAFTAPNDGEVKRDCEDDGESFTLSANFTDTEDDANELPLEIEWFEGEQSLGSTTTNDLGVTLNIGTHALTAVAKDSDGNTTSSIVSLNVEVIGAPSFSPTVDTVGGNPLINAEIVGSDITVCWDVTNLDVGGSSGEHFHLRLDGGDNGQGDGGSAGGQTYVRIDDASGCFTFANVTPGPHVISFHGAETGHNQLCDVTMVSFTVVDGTPPSIVSLSPSDDSSDVQLDETLQIIFDENIIPGPNTGSITIRESEFTGFSQSYSVLSPNVDIADNTVTITPLITLNPNKDYIVTISSDFVKDINDNFFIGFNDDSTWNFSTITTVDTDPPQIVSLNPLDNSINVGLDQNLIITFDEPVVINNRDAIAVREQGTNDLFEFVRISNGTLIIDGIEVTLNPSSSFEPGTGYYVQMAGDVFEDLSGNDFRGLQTFDDWNFTTTSNIAPIFINNATASVAENQSLAIDVNAEDDNDEEGNGLIYNLSNENTGGVDNGLFTIDASTGQVTFLTAPDFETPGDDDGDNDYEIQVTATDSDLLSTFQDITITVTDIFENTPPNAICQEVPIVLELDVNGIATLTAAQVDNGSNDIDGAVTLSIDRTSFSCDDIGNDITVTLTATDTNNSQATCEVTVQVQDNLDPSFVNFPPNIIEVSPQDLDLSTVIVPPTAADNCTEPGSIIIDFTRSDGEELTLSDPFPVGITPTMIMWTVTDEFGNIATQVQSISITAPLSGANSITAFEVPGQIGDEIINTTDYTVDITVAIGTDLRSLAPTSINITGTDITPGVADEQDFSNNNSITYTVTAENGEDQEWTVSIQEFECQIAITQQPENSTICDMEDASFTTVATGFGTLSYQWLLNGEPINNQTSATLSFIGLEIAANGNQYSVVITDDNGTPNNAADDCEVTSQVAILTVNPIPAPVITGDNTYPFGGAGSTLDAGAGFDTYSWSNGANTQIILAAAGSYTVTVTKDGCEGISEAFMVTEDPNPQIAVPDVVGLTEEFGTNTLEAEGLVVQVTYENNALAQGLVISQTPEDGTFVDLGSVVDLVVSLGPLPLPQLLITEVVDATLEGGLPKFVEITNVGETALNLADFSIGTFNNGESALGSASTVLSGTLAPCMSYIISYENGDEPGAGVFFDTYGFDPDNFDLGLAYNGDDVIALFQGPATGDGSDAILIDVYGAIGTDGTGEAWDYTNGYAFRNSGITEPSPSFNASEWTIGGADSLEADNDSARIALILSLTTPGATEDCSPPITNISIAATDAEKTEGNSGITDFTFKVTRSGNTAGVTTVDYALSGDVDLNDFGGVVPSGTVTFTDTETTQEIKIQVSGDTDKEPDESFTVTLSNATNDAIIATDAANGLIENDDNELPIADAGNNQIVTDNNDDSFEEVTLNGSGSIDDGIIVSYEWSANGITIPSVASPMVLFPIGTTVVTLTVTDDQGASDTDTVSITVNPAPPTDDAVLFLVNTGIQEDPVVGIPLVDGLIINKDDIGTILKGIVYVADHQLVQTNFNLSGPINENRNEGSQAPQSLFGDKGVSVNGKVFPIGNYTLIVTPNGQDQITINFSIVEDQGPSTDFVAVQDLNVAYKVSFTDTSSDNDGAITSWSWDFNDDGQEDSSEQNPMFNFGDAGDFDVTLTVTDNDNQTDSVTKTVTAIDPNENQLPIITLLGANPLTIEQGNTFVDPGASVSDLEDGNSTIFGDTSSLNVDELGMYLVPYNYTDSDGGSADTKTRVVNVVEPVPVDAKLFFVDADLPGDPVLFPLVDGTIVSKSDIGNRKIGVIYVPDVQPGSTTFKLTGPINQNKTEGSSMPISLFGDKGINVIGKVFPVGDDYKLVVNPSNAPVFTVNFQVLDGPPTNQNPNAVASGVADDEVALQINFSGANSSDFEDGNNLIYLWNFGGGNTSTAVNPSFIFDSAGEKSVTLTVTDTEGTSDSTTIAVSAVDPDDDDAQKVISFVLVDAEDNSDINELTNNAVIPSGNEINIRANTNVSVGSVSFSLTGPVLKQQVESVAPYALFGDSGGDYVIANLPDGDYSLTATPFSASGGNGEAGISLKIDFTIGIPPSAMATVEPANTMSVSPNPARDEVSLGFAKPVQISEFQVFDVSGRLVRTIKEFTAKEGGGFEFQTYDLPVGTYYIKTKSEAGEEFRKQMVIKR